MALVKCKECGEDVSSKAKSCPKCGAKPAKQTSALTWIIFFIIFYFIYKAVTLPTDYSTSSVSNIEKIIETFLSIFDLIKLLLINKNDDYIQHDHLLISEELNLDERI